MKIDSIVVLCWKGDFRLARICLASVRFFYPEIPLFLMKDTSKGHFDTSEIESCLNLSTVGLSGAYGPGAGKLELLFRPDLGRFLFIDADQIMAGPVLSALEASDADFVVTADDLDVQSPTIERLYYDRERLKAIDPSFPLPTFQFNSGQFVGTAGVLSRDDFEGLVEWGRPIKICDPRTFKMYEQGVLNYVVHKAARAGRLTLETHDFMHLARTEYFWNVPLQNVRAKAARPLLFHWAGTHRIFVSFMRRSDLLRFFEGYYYSRVRHGSWRRLWRSLKAAPKNACLSARQLAGACKQRAFSQSKKHFKPTRPDKSIPATAEP